MEGSLRFEAIARLEAIATIIGGFFYLVLMPLKDRLQISGVNGSGTISGVPSPGEAWRAPSRVWIYQIEGRTWRRRGDMVNGHGHMNGVFRHQRNP